MMCSALIRNYENLAEMTKYYYKLFDYKKEFNSEEEFKEILKRDQQKEKLCKEHGLKFLKINISKPLTTEELSNLLYGIICNN